MAKASAKKVADDELNETSAELSATGDTASIVEFSEDISSAEAPDPLPIGDNYPMEITKVLVGPSKSSGRMQAAVNFLVSPEDYPADYDPANNPDGVTVTKYLSMEDNAKSRYQVRVFEETIGLPPSGRQVDTARWTGQTCLGAISHEPFEGVPRERLGKLKKAI